MYFEKSMLREPVTGKFIHLCTECYLVEYRLATKIEIAILESYLFTRCRMFRDFKRWHFRLREDFCMRDHDFYLTRREFLIGLAFWTSTDDSYELHDILRAACICHLPGILILRRIIDRLCDTISISQVDEYESSMIATIRDPASESDSLSDMFCSKLSSGVCAVHR